MNALQPRYCCFCKNNTKHLLHVGTMRIHTFICKNVLMDINVHYGRIFYRISAPLKTTGQYFYMDILYRVSNKELLVHLG